MTVQYSKNLSLLHALCLAELRDELETQPSTNLDDYDPVKAASYLACYITSKAIKEAGRMPADERYENFDMLSVYQTFALMTYAYLVLPMASEEIVPDLEQDQIVIAKTLFSELGAEELADIVESGMRKFSLVGNADAEHWANFREDMNKVVIAFVVAGTDDAAPFEKEELIPVLGAFLSMLCEAFA